MKRTAWIVLAAVLAGCAHVPPVEVASVAQPITSYADDPFVPVNLYFNANESATGQQAALVEYATRQLKDSRAFMRLDRGVQRWPITLQASYRLERGLGPGDALRSAALWATLGLMPVRIAAKHELTVEIFQEPETSGVIELTLVSSDRVSLYDTMLANPDRDERAAMDVLLERLLAEIAARKMVPRWKDFKPEPRKKEKDKKKPLGRET